MFRDVVIKQRRGQRMLPVNLLRRIVNTYVMNVGPDRVQSNESDYCVHKHTRYIQQAIQTGRY